MDVGYIIRHIFDGIFQPVHYLRSGFTSIGIEIEHFIFCIVIYFLPLCVFDYSGTKNNKDAIAVIEGWSVAFRWVFYILLLLIIVLFSQKGVAAEFVYFQF